jgi:hypothetical protein
VGTGAGIKPLFETEQMKMQIVIAWLEEEQVLVKAGRTDLGESHKFKSAPKPMACMWLNKGSHSDLEKAQNFAAKEGHTVFSYNGEKNPLERAKKEISLTAQKL